MIVRERPARGEAEGALVLFHGRGADEHDLFPLLDVLDPERRFDGYTPRGPLSLPPGGAHWYVVPRVGFPDPGTFWDSYREASGWLATLPHAKLVLGGFSQGCVMALALGLGDGRRPDAVCGFSGFVPVVDGWQIDSSRPLPPVALGHGTLDPVIPVEFGRAARDSLEAAGRGAPLPRVPAAAHARPALPRRGARLARRARLRGSAVMSEVVLVTGSSSGIGRAVAERFGRDGARVVVNSSRSAEEGERVAGSLPDAVYVQGDVSREDEAQRLVAAALERFGRLDVVVNNAGTTRRVPFADLDGADDELWRRILDVNLMGPWYLSRAAVPALRETSGAIVNVGSVAGIVAGGSSLPYAVSKAALHHLTRTLAQALAPGVRVNAVAPGLVETPWTAGWESNEAIVARTPLGRPASAEDVADAVVWLARAPFTTGQVVVVDGGLTLT